MENCIWRSCDIREDYDKSQYYFISYLYNDFMIISPLLFINTTWFNKKILVFLHSEIKAFKVGNIDITEDRMIER